MQVILDISANTHKNDIAYFIKMLDAIKEVDNRKHEIIIKGQLFRHAGDNVAQDKNMFLNMAYQCNPLYQLTASVFDLLSLKWLLGEFAILIPQKELPFIKIANNRELDYLIGEIPRKIPVYQSVDPEDYYHGYDDEEDHTITQLLCISKYPAVLEDYRRYKDYPARSVSDHTIGLELINHYKPKIYECHFALEDSSGLDAGPWAKRPNELKEILDA